jgi:DNA-binding NarL/FixJ family response regulator
MKREASDKVLEAIRRILRGGVFVSDRIAAGVLDKVSGRPLAAPRSPMDVLTDREVEVLALIGKGHGSQQIARELHISVKTVEAHRANIKSKLNLKSSSDLLQRAIGWARQMGEV